MMAQSEAEARTTENGVEREEEYGPQLITLLQVSI